MSVNNLCGNRQLDSGTNRIFESEYWQVTYDESSLVSTSHQGIPKTEAMTDQHNLDEYWLWRNLFFSTPTAEKIFISTCPQVILDGSLWQEIHTQPKAIRST
jgi:hypothetical protein